MALRWWPGERCAYRCTILSVFQPPSALRASKSTPSIASREAKVWPGVMEPKIFDLGGADGRWDGFLGPPKVTFALAVGNPPFIQAFEQGLREPGYVDGQNIAIEYRPWAGEEQLQLQAAELV